MAWQAYLMQVVKVVALLVTGRTDIMNVLQVGSIATVVLLLAYATAIMLGIQMVVVGQPFARVDATKFADMMSR